MFYIFKFVRVNNNKSIYHLFGTHSESVLKVSEKLLIQLITKKGLKAKNIRVENDKIEINKWPHSIESNSGNTESNYILIGNIAGSQFKMIDSAGKVDYCGGAELKALIEAGRVLNCVYVNHKNKLYKSIDTYNIRKDQKFIDQTYVKYVEFKTQTLQSGLDVEFDYIIEDEEVKITRYTGKSTRVLIPGFVTTILAGAYSYRGITELKLNEGLQYIGNLAFAGNNITFVLLPYSVKIVGKAAFDNDIRGVHKKIYKRLNPNTIIIN